MQLEEMRAFMLNLNAMAQRVRVRTSLKSYSFRVVLQKDEDVYLATVPALPGCHTWGYSQAEALQNIQDAIETYIADLLKQRSNSSCGRPAGQ